MSLKDKTIDYVLRTTWLAVNKMYNEEAAKFETTMATGFALLNIDPENGTPSTALGPKMGMEATSLSRTLKTMEYNNLLQELSFKKGYNYIDITSDIIGDNNLVNHKFLSDDDSDHHLSNERSYNLWLAKIQQLYVKATPR